MIAPEAKNILVRHFYQQNGDEKVSIALHCMVMFSNLKSGVLYLLSVDDLYLQLSLSSKRASSQNQTADRASKLARTSASQNV